MSSASSDSWSQADIEALSIASSPMSTTSCDLPAMPTPGPALDTVNVSTPDSEPGVAQSRQRSPMPDAFDDRSFKRSKYYMSEDDIFTAVVEDTVFKLHAFFFKRESARFRELLETHNKTSRLVLTDTKAEDLERFLDLLYPDEIGPESYTSKTAEEWTSILRIAHRWDFPAIHKLALQRLEPVASPVDKIVCARTLGATDWLVGAYTALCTRAEPLTFDEGMRLGVAALHGRKDVLATEDILRVGLKEITCINDAREEIHRSKKKGPDASTLVQKKLEDSGLLPSGQDVVKSPASGALGDSSGSASEKMSREKGKVTFTVPVHERVYKQPRLDIRDQSGQSILDGDLDSDIDWLLHGSQDHFKLRRINTKLVIVDPGSFGGNARVNGDQHSTSCSLIDKELKHGDVIAFFGDTALSPLDKHIVCLPDTGYIICREDAPVGSAEWPAQMPVAARSPGHFGAVTVEDQQYEVVRRWTSEIDNNERTIADLEKKIAVDEICLAQGRLSDLEPKLEKTRQQIRDIITGLSGPVYNLMCVAQRQAQNPLQRSAWSPYVASRHPVTLP